MPRERAWPILLLTTLVVVVMASLHSYQPISFALAIPLVLGAGLAATVAVQKRFTGMEGGLLLAGVGWILLSGASVVSWTSAGFSAASDVSVLATSFSRSFWAEGATWAGACWLCWVGVVACVWPPGWRASLKVTLALVVAGVVGAVMLNGLTAVLPEGVLPRSPLTSGFAVGVACVVFASTGWEPDRVRRGFARLLSGLAIAPAAMLDGFGAQLRTSSPAFGPEPAQRYLMLFEMHTEALTSPHLLVSIGVALSAGAFVFLARSRTRNELRHLGLVAALLYGVIGSGGLLVREAQARFDALHDTNPSKARVDIVFAADGEPWHIVRREPLVSVLAGVVGLRARRPRLARPRVEWVSVHVDRSEPPFGTEAPLGEVLERVGRASGSSD